jgi:hypothetical protein
MSIVNIFRAFSAALGPGFSVQNVNMVCDNEHGGNVLRASYRTPNGAPVYTDRFVRGGASPVAAATAWGQEIKAAFEEATNG